jgi:serine/threonine protein kinase
MGTADYLPPEILLGGSNQNPNVAQDLWLWAESGRTSALTLNVIAFSLVVSLMTMTNATSIEVTLLSVLYNTVL